MNTPSGAIHRAFPVSGPIRLDVKVGLGSVTVHAREDLTEAVVTVSPRRPQSDSDLADLDTRRLGWATFACSG